MTMHLPVQHNTVEQIVELRNAAIGTLGAQFDLDQIARDHHRPQLPPSPTRYIARDNAMFLGEHATDHCGFAMRASGDQDCWRAQMHRSALGLRPGEQLAPVLGHRLRGTE